MSDILMVMSSKQTLGDRLKILRNKLKLPQIEVATAVGISRSHLAEIEGGKDPGFRTFCDLACFFDVSLDYLQFGVPSPSSDQSTKSTYSEEELALLEFWRGLTDEEKRLLAGLFKRGPDQVKVA